MLLHRLLVVICLSCGASSPPVRPLATSTLPVSADAASWQRLVKPVFERACVSCHKPGGDADLDLTTPAAWTAWRGEIVQAVLVDRSMPPPGTDLTETERQALVDWSKLSR